MYRIRGSSYLRNLWTLTNHPNTSGRESNSFKTCLTLVNVANVNQHREFSVDSLVESTVKFQANVFKTLSESTPVEYVQDFLIYTHDKTGLPWWANIVLCTIALRTCVTLPLGIYQNYILARLENLNKEMPAIIEELKKETAMAIRMFNWDEKTAKYYYRKSLKKQWNNLIVRDNCHPFKASLLLWFQIPLWISTSIALRNLVYMLPKQDLDSKLIFLDLSTGGVAWFANLTSPDPFILPVILGIVNLMIIELQVFSKVNSPTKLQRILTNVFRGVSIVMVPLASFAPSGVVLYWTVSSTYGLFQNIVIMSPKFRRLCGIPKTPRELEKPYSHMFSRMREKYLLKSPE